MYFLPLLKNKDLNWTRTYDATQATKFLGASVCSFTTTLGWGSQPSQLTVILVEDVGAGDNFTPPIVGCPVYFRYNRMYFGGLLQSWKEIRGSSSNPIYEVVVMDPREILNGVQLILDGYTGDTTSIPNLYNIYRYWEGTGFGNSLANDTGIPWGKIVTAFDAMQYAKPILFRGYDYLVDFTLIENLPTYYRVNGNVISLMDFINDVCEATGCDYFVKLNAGDIIKIHTITRRIIPVVGAVNAFVATQTGANAKETSRELRSEYNGKFLAGGQKEEMYFAWYVDASGSISASNNYIWPYWGKNLAGDAILGVGTGTSHELTLDTTALRDSIVGNSYTTDTAEMRAALAGESEWMKFLLGMNSVSGSIHYGKADDLHISATLGDWESIVEGKTKEEMKGLKVAELAPFISPVVSDMQPDPNKFKRIHQFYNWYSNYANNYYGKQFMVRTPFIDSAFESETGRIISTYEPVDSAFIDESNYNGGIAAHILPSGLHRFSDSNNKIYSYVRFNDTGGSGLYDLSELGEDDYERFDGYVFVKASIDPNLVYLDRSALSGPRVVLSIAGRVKPRQGIYAESSFGAFEDLLEMSEGVGPKLSETEKREIIARAGADSLYLSREGLSYIPNMAAAPLRSNINTYGPWYAYGADGKMLYEQDESLVPWNYGGYTQLNVVGNAKVNTAISYEQYNEGGVITVPGSPDRNLGDQLVVQSGYPYITNVNVSAGADGITTTYYLQQWTPRFGTLAKYNIERLKDYSLGLQKTRHRIRYLNSLRDLPKQTQGAALKKEKPKRKYVSELSRSSSSAVILGEVVPILYPSGQVVASGDTRYSNLSFSEVVIAPYHNVGVSLGYNYTRKGMASLDSIFRPFDITYSGYIDPHSSGILMPRFETPSGNAETPTIEDLNPFIEPHDMSMFIQGSSVPLNGLAIGASGTASDNQYRPMGLKAPLMLVGWGYDIDDNPIPNTGDGSFIPRHRQRQDQWKVGPLDARWNDTRKVWEAGGGSKIKVAKLSDVLYPGSNATANLMSGATYNSEGEEIEIYDPLYSSFGVPSEKLTVHRANSRYEVVGENGLFRTCVLLTPLTAGGACSGLIDEYGYETIHDNILMTGQTVESGVNGYTSYDRYYHKWFLTQVSCSGIIED